MSMIPVDLRLAKMLVLGTIFKCLDPGWLARSERNIQLTDSSYYRCDPFVETAIHFFHGKAGREQKVRETAVAREQLLIPQSSRVVCFCQI